MPLRTATRRLGVAVIRPGCRRSDELAPADRRTVEALAGQAATALERTLLAERHERAERGGRGRAAPHGAAELALPRSPHAARQHRGRGEQPAQDAGALARRRAAGARRDDPGGVAADDAAGGEPARHGAGRDRRAWRCRRRGSRWRRRSAWRCCGWRSGSAAHPVESRLPADLPLVPIDELLIEQVFINLLENAAQVHARRDADHGVGMGGRRCAWWWRWRTAGPGVPPGCEEAVFRKFYRAAGGRSRRAAPGSG